MISDTDDMPRIPAPWAARAEAVREAETERFDRLIALSGLDPQRHLRLADWSGVDFSGCDLRGFDFSGARLTGCNFEGALITGARFDQAEIDHAAPALKSDTNWGADWGSPWSQDRQTRTDLRAAADWDAYVKGWQKPRRAAGDRHLPTGAVFQDAPFAPELVVVPSGRFIMGSPEDEEGRDDDEGPRHEVTMPERLAVGRYPVTFWEWDFAATDGGIDGYRPEDRGWGRDRRPVINVSWENAQAYLDWLGRKTGHDYRLLSEAEWEYCCRAGSETRYSFGEDDASLGDYAWYRSNSDNKTHPVGEKQPNAWGLYDLHGNVWEWCEDVWHESYKDKPAELSETGRAWTTGGGGARVLRGGSWGSFPLRLRSADRVRYTPDGRDYVIGFRVARTLTA